MYNFVFLATLVSILVASTLCLHEEKIDRSIHAADVNLLGGPTKSNWLDTLPEQSTAFFSLSKRAPIPLPGGQISRGYFRAAKPAEEVQNTDQVQEDDQVKKSSLLPSDDEDAGPSSSGRQNNRPKRFTYRRGLVPLKKRLAIWKRLLTDLRQIPHVEKAFEDWELDLRRNRAFFWDRLPDDRAISWRMQTYRRRLLARRKALQKSADYKTRSDYGWFIRQFVHNQIEPWPELKEPAYRFFQLEYEKHLNAAEITRDRIQTIEQEHPRQDVSEFTAQLTAEMEHEAMQAWDVYNTLRMTYRNIYAEYMQTVTQVNNLKRGRDAHYLEAFTHGNKALMGQDPL